MFVRKCNNVRASAANWLTGPCCITRTVGIEKTYFKYFTKIVQINSINKIVRVRQKENMFLACSVLVQSYIVEAGS